MPTFSGVPFKSFKVQWLLAIPYLRSDFEVEPREFEMPVGSVKRKNGQEEQKMTWKGGWRRFASVTFSSCTVLLTPDRSGASYFALQTLEDMEEGSACIWVALRHPENLAFQAAIAAVVKDCHSAYCLPAKYWAFTCIVPWTSPT